MSSYEKMTVKFSKNTNTTERILHREQWKFIVVLVLFGAILGRLVYMRLSILKWESVKF